MSDFTYPALTPAFAAAEAPALAFHLISTAELPDFLAGSGADFANWLKATGFEAKLGELRLIPDAKGNIIAAVGGLGSPAARARSRFGLARAVSALPKDSTWELKSTASGDTLTEICLAWLLSAWRFTRYRSTETGAAPPQLRVPEGIDSAKLLAMARAEYLTRDLISTPACDMGPDALEAAFLGLAARFGASTRVITGDDLLRQNFPLVHAVGRASAKAPRIMDLHWGNTGPRLTLVGKGVCFDTGGLDLKPSSGMLLMKKDMGGAATVMGLAQAIMELNLPLQLRVIIPAVENMVDGNAMKPKDILTSRKGLTVEVNNTDAEGRLILADALTWAGEEDCDALISMATLTGAARVALGPDLAPYYAQDDAMAAALEKAATSGFDPVWRMPFHEAYEPVIEPGIADLDNAPSFGFAGSITAALFLRRFADHPRYMHFDIYGHSPSDAPARPKGAAGQGARAILNALPDILGL